MTDKESAEKRVEGGRFAEGTAPGPGRPAGVPNKSTTAAREAIARFVDGNCERLQEWLDEIAKTDGPKAAFTCLVSLLDYHLPKLARTELSGDLAAKGTFTVLKTGGKE